MRAVSGTLEAAQKAAKRTPYIHMVFTSKDGLTTRDFSSIGGSYTNRISLIDHIEEAYNDYALVTLRDYDSSVPNMVGYWTEIGYGDVTGGGNEYAATSRLWVKHQRHITAGGKLYTVLELEGVWSRIRNTLLRLGSPPLYQTTYTTSTIYTILKVIFAECGLSLPTSCPVNDTIIDTLQTEFDVNSYPFESADGVAYRLIRLTKCFLLPPSSSGLQFGVVYPQTADSAILTYYSGQSPYFHSFMERAPALTPNYFIVFGNRGDDGNWTNIITSASPHGISQTDIDALYVVYNIALAPALTVQADVDNQADARLARARAEQDTGLGIIPHDCRVELYDKLAFVDSRRSPQTTYPTHALTRVSGLHHLYSPGGYRLEVYLGGLSVTGTEQFTADTFIVGASIEGRTVSEGVPVPTTTPAPAPEPVPVSTWWTTPQPDWPSSAKVTAPQPPIPSELISVSKPVPTESTIHERIVSPFWQAITPWKEEEGEAFGKEVTERIESLKKQVKSLWGRLFGK